MLYMLCTISCMLYTVVYMLCVCCIHGVYILYMLNSNQNCYSSQSMGAIATESRAVHMDWTSLGTGMINMVRECVNSIHCSLLPQWLTPEHHWVFWLPPAYTCMYKWQCPLTRLDTIYTVANTKLNKARGGVLIKTNIYVEWGYEYWQTGMEEGGPGEMIIGRLCVVEHYYCL